MWPTLKKTDYSDCFSKVELHVQAYLVAFMLHFAIFVLSSRRRGAELAIAVSIRPLSSA